MTIQAHKTDNMQENTDSTDRTEHTYHTYHTDSTDNRNITDNIDSTNNRNNRNNRNNTDSTDNTYYTDSTDKKNSTEHTYYTDSTDKKNSLCHTNSTEGTNGTGKKNSTDSMTKEVLIEGMNRIKMYSRLDSTLETRRILSEICPHVNLDKYLIKIDSKKDKIDSMIDSMIDEIDSKKDKIDGLYPLYLSVIEEALLYPCDLSRESLCEIVCAVREGVSSDDLLHIHTILSNSLGSSCKYSYSIEYDRWLILSVIKITEIAKKDEYILKYFPVITDRLNSTDNGFRDRAIILSDYLIQSELIHQSAESVHFFSDIPSVPIVEEEDSDSVENTDGIDEITEITALSEYHALLKEESFTNQPAENISRIVRQLPLLISKEPVTHVQKYAPGIVEALISLGTEESTDAVCTVLLQGEIGYDLFYMVYERRKSFYFRRVLVACLINVSSRLRKDVSLRITERYFNNSHENDSEEDKKLGIDILRDLLMHRG